MNKRLTRDGDILRLDGDPLKLSPMEQKILLVLLDHPCECLTAKTIGEMIGEDLSRIDPVTAVTIQVHIHNLRRKLEGDPSRPAVLRSVRGKGYTLAEV